MKGEFYKMDYEAWDEGTDALSLELEGAYLRLCHQLYRRKASIPSEPATLARIWRVHPNKARKLLADLIAAGKVVEANGHLTNTRVTRELDARETRRTQQADAGHTGGTRAQQNRRKSLEGNDRIEAVASTPDKRNQAEREGEREKNTPVAPKGAGPDLFEAFRSAYPKRNATFPTTPARKRWAEAMKRGDDPAAIVAGAKAYAAEQARLNKIGTEYVKSADSWLYQQRWRDFAGRSGSAPASQGSLPMAEGGGSAGAAHPYAHWPEDQWRQSVREWRSRGGDWPWKRSPPPDDPNTAVPRHILAEMNIHPARARAA